VPVVAERCRYNDQGGGRGSFSAKEGELCQVTAVSARFRAVLAYHAGFHPFPVEHEQRQGLQCLAEAHVVSKATAEVV